MIVLDSGAVIAMLKFEAGAAVVRQLLRDNQGQCFMHAVNVLEVHYGSAQKGGVAYADRVLDTMDRAQIEIRNDLDRAFLQDTSFLKVNHKMSLADTFAVALARRLSCELISTDHHELDAVVAAGVCQINFIR